MERRQRARVLVIEDDEKLGNLIARALTPEYDVTLRMSAREALDHIVRGERFDVVFCDLMLPGMSGVDFHERLVLVAPEMVDHVVFLTGGAFTPRARAFLEKLTIPRIEKPFSLAELRQVIRQHLARRADRSQT